MAKSVKTPAGAAKKSAAPAKKTAASSEVLIERACESALDMLNALNLDFQLQSEINWCLGSYRNDGNPIGLYQMAERAIVVLREEQLKKTKGVTAKLITDLEKAIKNKR